MTIEALERIHQQPDKNRKVAHPQTVKKTDSITRRSLLARLLGGGAGIAIGAKLGFDMFKNQSTPEQPLSEKFNVETYDFPTDYKHDLILPPTPIIAATDGGASVEVSPKRYIVTLSDTLQGKLIGSKEKFGIQPRTERWINNAALLFDENTQEVTFITGPSGEDGNQSSWIKPSFDEEEGSMMEGDVFVGSRYWPQTPVVENGDLFITLDRTKPHIKDMWWDEIGTDIARFPSGKLNTKPEITKLPRVEAITYRTNWGSAILQDGKKQWTYIAGSTEQLYNNPYHTKELCMARAPYGQMDQLKKWEFWNGKEWVGVNPLASTKDQINSAWRHAEKQTKTIIDNTQGLSNGFTMHNIDGQVVLTTKNTDFLGETIDVFLGESPTGPFKKHTIIDKEELQKLIPSTHRPNNGKSWSYLALLHPELPDPEKRDRMLVTFCISPDVDRPGDAMKENVNTYSRIPVWVDRNKILNNNQEALKLKV